MKKIITFFSAAILWSGLSFAQTGLPHADISVQMIKPAVDTTVAYGDSLYISFNYTNNGPDMLPAGDTLFFGIGGLLIYSVILQPMLPGNTFVYNDVAYFHNPTDSTLSFDLCVAIVPQADVQYTNGGIPATTYIDDDSTNDMNCHHVTLQGPDSNTNSIHGWAFTGINALRVYPDPVAENLSFELPGQRHGSPSVSIVVSDMTGRIVLKQEAGEPLAGEQRFSVNVSALPSGVYILKAYAGTQSWRAKFVKK
ncbi:MAG TPA: T9SS type A sorting domain-containing protein [Edaphocola sp.]|nr:T9SS type A sorting domain-containing protein [Edaphocola sp.]